MLINAFPGFDCHMHSLFSDGSASLETMAQAAVDKGLAGVIFTDHMPLPFQNRYTLTSDRTEAYRNAVKEIRTRMDGQLTVLMGLEMESLPSHRKWTDALADTGWDKLIASVHFVEHDGEFAMINGTEAEFLRSLSMDFSSDIHRLVTAYYHQLMAMARSGRFHIVGHIDVVKKHNAGNRFFDEAQPWYRDLVEETLDAVQTAGMVVEINTGGISHPVQCAYPSRWILERISERKIPVCLSSDAHRPEDVGRHFPSIRATPGKPRQKSKI